MLSDPAAARERVKLGRYFYGPLNANHNANHILHPLLMKLHTVRCTCSTGNNGNTGNTGNNGNTGNSGNNGNNGNTPAAGNTGVTVGAGNAGVVGGGSHTIGGAKSKIHILLSLYC